MKNITNYLALGAVALGFSGAAQAVPTLQLTSGASVVTIVDNGPGDSNPAVGAVTYIGAIGGWATNVSTGLTKPILGSPSSPKIDLNSVNVSSTGAASLKIEFSDTGFTQIGTAVASIGGTQAFGNLTYAAYWSASNVALATTNLLSSQSFDRLAGDFDPSFAGSVSGGAVTSNLYSLTQVVTITHTGAGSTSFDAELTVPDSGSTIALLGAALATLGLISRRRKVA
jgi:hypothetical protein